MGIIKISSLLVVLSYLLITSCKDEIPKGNGSASAIKNDKNWEASIFYRYSGNSQDTINFFLFQYNEEGYKRNSLNFYQIPLCMGKKELHNFIYNNPSVKLNLSYDDGHVSGDRYHLIEGHPINHFELTNLNSKTGRINGEFELAMIVDTTLNGKKLDPNMPDTVIFREGEFEFYLKDD